MTAMQEPVRDVICFADRTGQDERKNAPMAERFEIPADFTVEKIQITMGALYLCLEHAMAHIAKAEGGAAAAAFQRELVTGLKNGDIDMSLLDDARTFDFVVPLVERLAAAELN